jgi:tRNA-splicing endonuclease subunit sen54 N-term
MHNSRREAHLDEGSALRQDEELSRADEAEYEQEEGEDSLLVPIRCHLDPRKAMFRVTRARGKAFSSGGFGVTFSTNDNDNDGVESDASEHDAAVKTPRESHMYLFLEEVLFLFEQGMLECQAEEAHDNVLSSPQLYAFLETLQVPTAAYLVYAHLRQQTFRVVRYTSQRLALLQQLETCTAPSRRKLRFLLRHDIQNAPPPPVLCQPNNNNHLTASSTCTNSSQQADTPSFAFLVYPPDCNFAKSDPGLPAFLVAVTHYGQSGLDYAAVQNLLRQARGIPVKLATVSDSGTVVMFGITDYGVPPLP